jgi:putative transcriptional regulator
VNIMHIENQTNTPLDALLASYAVGHVSRPLHALIASHLCLSDRNRIFVNDLETFVAREMEHSSPLHPVLKNRNNRLANIFDEAKPAGEEAKSVGKEAKSVGKEEGAGKMTKQASPSMFPEPLAAFIGKSYDTLKWNYVMPGLREVKLEDRAGCEASLLWIKAGRAMPSHTHAGIEATLVLQGSFSDNLSYFARGDMAVVDSSIDHKPVAGSDEDCICFAVSEGPVHLTGPLARIFNWMKKH